MEKWEYSNKPEISSNMMVRQIWNATLLEKLISYLNGLVVSRLTFSG